MSPVTDSKVGEHNTMLKTGNRRLSRLMLMVTVALATVACKRAVPGKERALVVVFGPQYVPAAPEQLRTELERRSGLELEFEVASSNDAAVDLVQSGRADAALLPLFEYLYCEGVFGVQPLAQVVRNGVGTQAGELLVPAQSSVKDLSELRGQRVGYVSRSSVTGYLLAAAQLGRASVSVEPVWLGSHEAVLAALREGKVAAAATYAGQAGAGSGLRVVVTTAPFANEPLFVQSKIPAEVREALKQALVAEHDPKSLQGLANASGFRVPPVGAYENAGETLEAAGLRVEDTIEGGWPRANEHRRPAWSYEP